MSTPPLKPANQPIPGQSGSKDSLDIFENAPVGIFKTTPEGRFIAANQALAKSLGYDDPQDLIDSVTDIANQLYSDPDDRKKILSMLGKTGLVEDHECLFVRKDRSLVWVSTTAWSVRDNTGKASHIQGFAVDISRRKQAEEDLRQQKRILQSINDNMFDLVSLTDMQGGFKYIGASHAILGYDHDDLMGRNVMDLVHPEDLPAVREAFQSFVSRLENQKKAEYRYRRADGEYLWFETVGSFVLDEQGSPVEIVFSTRDITDRKIMEERLAKSESLMRSLFDNISSGAAIYEVRGDGSSGKDYIVKDFNAASLKIEGMTKQEVIGRSLHDLRPNIDDFGLIPVFRKVWLTGEPAVFPAKIYVDEKYANWYENRVSRLPSGEIVAIYDDVTEQVTADRELKEKNMLLQGILDNIPDIMSVKKPDLTVVDYNRAGYRFLDKTKNQAQGKKCFELIGRNAPCRPCASLEALKTGKTSVLEKYQSELDIHLSCRANPIFGADGRIEYVVELLQDITGRKTDEQRLKDLNRKLQKVNIEKDMFLSILAHDLKSPLSGLMSIAKVLAQDSSAMTSENIELISSEIFKSSKNLLDLVNDLLQWSRMSQGNIEFSPESVYLDDLINQSLKTTQDVAKQKNISIHSAIPPDIMISADRAMMNTILRNLVSNAVKFSPKNREVVINANKDRDMVQIMVQDHGIGMDEDVLSRIFTHDKKKRQLGTEGEKGTGLGLILCREFIEKQGGEIRVESRAGQGTKVFFALPAG